MMNTTMSKPSGFAIAQALMLFITVFISVISKPRLLLLEINNQTNIPIEFRALLVSLPDFFVIALLFITAIRLVMDDPYRQRLINSVSLIVRRFGGLWWLVLVLWMAVGLVWSREPALQRFDTIHALLLLLMALIVADLIHEPDSRIFLSGVWGLLVSAAIQSVVAVLQILSGGPLGWWSLGEIDRFSYETTAFYRAPGLSMHPNYLGGYLVVALFAAVLLARQNVARGKSPVLPGVIGVMCIIGIVATLSRSAMLSALVGFTPLVIIWLLNVNQRLRPYIIGGIGLAVVAAAVWGYLVLAGNVQARIFSPREFFFDYSWEVVTQSPIIGVGAGNLMIAVGANRLDYVPHLLPVHNVYLYIWGELGLIGLALFLIGCFSILRRVRFTRDMLIWGCCFAAICIIMLFDNYWWAVHPFRVIFFWVLGLAWAFIVRETQTTTS
jgi:O-antigen ligase